MDIQCQLKCAFWTSLNHEIYEGQDPFAGYGDFIVPCGKRAASLHSSRSTRLQCLRNAECVWNNTAFVHSSSTAVFIRIPPDPLRWLRCAPPFSSSSLIWYQARPRSKNAELSRKQTGSRLHLRGLVHLCDYWINCSSGESTTAAYCWFHPSSGRVEAHLWCTLCCRAFLPICCL